MIEIYSVEDAQRSLLARKPIYQDKYSPLTVERTEALFGKGVTPPQAVAQILKSINEDGDTAVRKWSALIDKFDQADFVIPKKELEAAWGRIPSRLQEVLKKSDRKSVV